MPDQYGKDTARTGTQPPPYSTCPHALGPAAGSPVRAGRRGQLGDEFGEDVVFVVIKDPGTTGNFEASPAPLSCPACPCRLPDQYRI